MAAAIILFSLFDAIATGIGVARGFIDEGNMIARRLFEWSITGTCIAMFIWTTILVLWVSSRPYPWIKYAMTFVLTVKIVIAGMHLFWISYL